ncbi:sugar transferase [Bacillus tianshenii]|nr:sugar transferase [Bacillus tianshenii]
MNYIQMKCFLDKIMAFFLLVISSPLLIILSLFIMLEDSSASPIFRQTRIGFNNREFNIYKLRSMRTQTHKDGVRLSDSQRMLKIGGIIRKASFDELPQLVNILKGEMSFIGPRPLSVKYLPYYNEEEIKRHNVRPGISGWAQVNGRNTISWEDKFSFDVEYVKRISFLFDLKIFFLTIVRVLQKSGVQTRGEGSMEVDFHEHRKKQNSVM